MRCEEGLKGLKTSYNTDTEDEVERDIIEAVNHLALKIDQFVVIHGNVFEFHKWMIKGLLIVVCVIALGKELLTSAINLWSSHGASPAIAESK